MVQEVDTGTTPRDVTEKLVTLKRSTINLLYIDTLPMDSKSVCGILFMHIYVLENGPNSWIDVSVCIWWMHLTNIKDISEIV